MIYAIVVIGILLIILNFTLGKIQSNLYRQHVYTVDKRFSFERLEHAIATASNEPALGNLIAARHIYIVFLTLFYVEVVLIIIKIFRNSY